MNEPPDPDKTREIRTPPPDGPTRHIPVPPQPPDRPTQHSPLPPPPAPPPRHRPPPPPANRAAPKRHIPPPPPAQPNRQIRRPSEPANSQVPWWQTINRDRPAPPWPPASPAAPTPAAATAPPANPVPQQSSRTAPAWRPTLFVGAAVALAALATAALITQLPATSPTSVLDITQAQFEVERILRDPLDGYGLADVSGVVCNSGTNPVIRQGATFKCLAVVGGVQREISVVFQDADGTYAVDRPR